MAESAELPAPGTKVRCRATGCVGVVMPYEIEYAGRAFPVNFGGIWRIKDLVLVEALRARECSEGL